MTQKWTVRWRYPDGGGWQQTQVESDVRPTASTQIEAFPAPCPQYYDLVFTTDYRTATSAGAEIPSQCTRQVRQRTRRILGPFTGPFDRYITNRWWVQVDRYAITGEFIESVTLTSGCYLTTHPPPGSKVISITPVGIYEGQCVEGKCVFKVLVGDAVVFSEQNDVCPEVEVQEGQCPPGTIECGDCCLDCGQYAGDVRAIQSKLVQFSGKFL